MKILFVAPYYAPAWNYGGPTRSNSILCNALNQKQGLNVDVITTNANKRGRLPLEYMGWVAREQTNILYNDIEQLKPIFSIDFYRNFCRLINDYDLIHFTGLWQPIIQLCIRKARRLKMPYILSPRGALSSWAFRNKYILRKMYKFFLLKKNLDGANAIHFTSKQELLGSLYINKNNAFISPNALETDRLKLDKENGRKFRENLGITAKSFVILSLGRVHPVKGNEFLIQSMQFLSSKCALLIIGDPYKPDYLDYLYKIIDESKVADRVFFHQHVNDEKRNWAYSCADMFASMSFHENFGMTVIEALYFGLPVLVSPEVSLSKYLLENDIGYVIARDPKSIAASISGIMNELTSPEIAQVRKASVEADFSSEAIAQQMCLQYSRILGMDLG